MSTTYDLIADSFNEIIEDYKENDGRKLTHTTLSLNIEPTRQYSSQDIKQIRTRNNLTQNLLAKYIGVSKKTVEAWEAGRNVPNGPSRRLLEILDSNKVALVY